MPRRDSHTHYRNHNHPIGKWLIRVILKISNEDSGTNTSMTSNCDILSHLLCYLGKSEEPGFQSAFGLWLRSFGWSARRIRVVLRTTSNNFLIPSFGLSQACDALEQLASNVSLCATGRRGIVVPSLKYHSHWNCNRANRRIFIVRRANLCHPCLASK